MEKNQQRTLEEGGGRPEVLVRIAEAQRNSGYVSNRFMAETAQMLAHLPGAEKRRVHELLVNQAHQLQVDLALADRLVIGQHPPSLPKRAHLDRLAVDLDFLRTVDLDTQLRHRAVHRDPALANPVFDLAPGPQTDSGQKFLQAFSHQVVPLG